MNRVFTSVALALALTGAAMAQDDISAAPQCLYAGEAYSEGAALPNNQICQDGKWSGAPTTIIQRGDVLCSSQDDCPPT